MGATYWIMPTVLRGRREAAAPNSSRGTAVITPAESSSRKCPAPSETRVVCPCTPSTATATRASGVIMVVSAASVTRAGYRDPSRDFTSP